MPIPRFIRSMCMVPYNHSRFTMWCIRLNTGKTVDSTKNFIHGIKQNDDKTIKANRDREKLVLSLLTRNQLAVVQLFNKVKLWDTICLV